MTNNPYPNVLICLPAIKRNSVNWTIPSVAFQVDDYCRSYRFNGLDLREHWFRKPEEELESHPAPLKKGIWVRFKNVICRAGYFAEYFDAPYDLVHILMWELVLDSMDITYVRSPIPNDYSLGRRIHVRDLIAVQELTGQTEESFFRNFYYRARHEWLEREKNQFASLAPVDLRTLWYVNLPKMLDFVDENKTFVGRISGTKMHQLGRHQSGWDDSPAYLYPKWSQKVYYVNVPNCNSFEVHPSDILEVLGENPNV
jgi:hypothetical protein